ncbi:MAG: rod shape-determining protein MreC [bacterium]|nr:rod shape-determining protein MreC [bacterium]
MKFFRRPGFIAASALLVLLVLLYADAPLNIPVAWFTRMFIAPVADFLSSPVSDLAKENNELRSALQSLVGDRVLENQTAREKNDRTTITDWAAARFLPSPIIATALTSIHEGNNNFFLLDRGKRDGVTPYAAVVSGKGVLVGRIAKVQSALSFLRPLTGRGERFSVAKEGDPAVLGIAEGEGMADTLSISFVPRTVTIQNNDIIVTSGLDNGVPAGLPLGVIVDVIASENSPWQQVTIRPFISPSLVRLVGILIFSVDSE